ncbi:hypothetical protein L1887_03047 [Cichorium endivia]|nr:hypothetical protein L1887_03047 [Cichorium endivia]
MASKCSVLFLTFCLASIISQGLARRSVSVHPRPSKASILQCWAALFDLESCYTEFMRAAQNAQIDMGIGPTCCAAGRRMNFGCWPTLFPFNPFFPIQLKLYCSRYWEPKPQGPSAVSPPPTITPAPSPNVEGQPADIPIDEGLVALPLDAPPPNIGPFMYKPIVEVPIE